METKVRSLPGDQSADLEKKLEEFHDKPENAGFRLASAFPSPDGQSIILIFQKEG